MAKRKEQREYEYVCEKCGHNYRWCALTRHSSCPDCGGKSFLRTATPSQIRYKTDPYFIRECIVFSRHRIKAGRKRRAVWQTEKGADGRYLYLTCPSCVSIIDATWEVDGVYDAGFLNGCLVCPECQTHFWAYLEGWKP